MTKSLCQSMGLFESMFPDTINPADEHFKSFLENTILSEVASKLLSVLLTEQNAAVSNRADPRKRSAKSANARIFIESSSEL
ncbi:MAG: hypothetical protein FWH52_02895 [Synergistaceae bacterium]|nr:hypothetical protein [Synergistaceae bacterium]